MDNPKEHFGWPCTFGADIPFSTVRAEVDYRKMNFDQVVWFNTDFAEMARKYYLFTIGAGPEENIMTPGLALALSGIDKKMWIARIMARPAWTEFRCADHLERALSRVLRYNSGIKSFMLYDADRGVWVSEKETLASGMTIGSAIDSIINEFAMALSRAADLLVHISKGPYPEPGLKPQPSAGAASIAAWNQIDQERKDILKKIERVSKMARDIFQGKYQPIKALLRDRLSIDQTSWDSNTQWLVLRDGAVNVEEIYDEAMVNLYPFSPEHMMTMSLEVGLADAQASGEEAEWDRGVAKVLPDPEVRKYLQKRFGGALLGKPGLGGKSMVWQFGTGDTAKSTLQECIAGSRGVFAPYSIVSSANALTKSGERTGAGERFKAYARGKRFAIMSELDDGEQLAQADMKVMTGGETVSGTAKFSNAVHYYFTATIFMASNHPPLFPPGDTAARSRIHVVPFTHKLYVRSKDPIAWESAPESHRADEGWSDKVLSSSSERAAILRWVLDGLVLFGKEGIGELPTAMQDAAEEFAADADPASRLINSLLGKDGEFDASIRIHTDNEWDRYGYLERDGLSVRELETLLEIRASELKMVKIGEQLPRKWLNGAKSMLNDIGGKKKKVKTANGGGAYAYSRVKLIYAPLGVLDGIKR